MDVNLTFTLFGNKFSSGLENNCFAHYRCMCRCRLHQEGKWFFCILMLPWHCILLSLVLVIEWFHLSKTFHFNSLGIATPNDVILFKQVSWPRFLSLPRFKAGQRILGNNKSLPRFTQLDIMIYFWQWDHCLGFDTWLNPSRNLVLQLQHNRCFQFVCYFWWVRAFLSNDWINCGESG